MKFKKTLGASIISVVLSIMLLAGTTFAWFTDTVTNTENLIEMGILEVDLEKYTGAAQSDDNDGYVSIANGEGTLLNSEVTWEPGMTQIVYLKAQNAGDLALDYSFILEVTDAGEIKPEDAFEYVIIDVKKGDSNEPTSWDAAKTLAGESNVADLTAGIETLKEGDLEEEESDYFALALHMKESAGNGYQGGTLKIDVQLVAKQSALENDVFGGGFDSNAGYGEDMWIPEVEPEQPGPQEPQDLYKEDFESGIWELWTEGTGAVATSDVNNKYAVFNAPSASCGYKALKSPIITNPGLEEGKTYKISFWIKNEACTHEGGGYAHTRVGVAFYNGNTAVGTVYEHGGYSSTECDATHCIKAGRDGWEQYEIEFTALAGDGIQIAVENRRYNSDRVSHGNILIDDITINPVE